MKAIVHDGFGGIERLRLAERPRPVLGPADVLVRVAASSVNPIDWKLRKGGYRLLVRGPFPRVPGADLAGEVVATGSDVSDLAPGRRVFGLTDPLAGGALAEFAAVPRARLVATPDGVSDETAASVPLAGLTALQGLEREGGLGRGGRCLVLGASGGVGTFAVQIAKLLGAHVTATTSARHLELVRGLGADVVVDHAVTAPDDIAGSFDTVFDVVTASSFGRMRDRLAPQGSYVSTAPRPDTVAMAVLSAFAGRRARIVVMRADPADLARLARWLGERRLAPVIGHRFALAEAAGADALSESGRATGKIVVAVASSDAAAA